MRKCATKYCRRPSRHPTAKLCNKCRHRKYKAEDPIKYTFTYFRQNAKRRGKEFSLTLEQFKIFVAKTDYINLKGKTKLSLSIDRIDNKKGYHLNNIRAITLSENSFKRAKAFIDGKIVACHELPEDHPDFVPF